MVLLDLSNIAVDEIINALQEHSINWKKGMNLNDIPFSDNVILQINEQRSKL